MKGRRVDEALLKERHAAMLKAQAISGTLSISQIAAAWYLSTSSAWNYLQKLVEPGLVIYKKLDRYHVEYWAVTKPRPGGLIVHCPYCGRVLTEGENFAWACEKCQTRN